MSGARRLPPALLVVLLSLVVSLASLTLVSSRGAFSDSTDNAANSYTAAACFDICQVQDEDGETSGIAASVTASYGAAPTQDNLLVLVHHFWDFDEDIGNITLPAGWTQAVTRTGTGSRLTIAYKVAGAAEGTDVTVSNNPSGHQTITIFEYSGIDTVSPLDRTASNQTTSTTSCSTGTTATTSVAEELVIGAIGLEGASGGWANTWTNSFTQQSTVVSSGSGGAPAYSDSSTADRIVSATGTFETTESWTTTRRCLGTIATFEAAP